MKILDQIAALVAGLQSIKDQLDARARELLTAERKLEELAVIRTTRLVEQYLDLNRRVN